MPNSKSAFAAIAVSITLVAPYGAFAASTITYTYDVFGQLVATNSTAGRVVGYTYDAAGNRTNISATGTVSLNRTAPTTGVLAVQSEASPAAQPVKGSTFIKGASVASIRAMR